MIDNQTVERSLMLKHRRWGVLSLEAILLLVGVLSAPSVSHASDLAEALATARVSLGDSVLEGYEEYVDYDPNEALGVLLSLQSNDEVINPTDTYIRASVREDPASMDALQDMFQEELPPPPRVVPEPPPAPRFSDLGSKRLSFQALEPVIREASAETGLPIALIDAVIRTESGYRTQAVSTAGARGLMQLMPRTARSVGVEDPFDHRQNVLGGSRYLRQMYDKFGSLELAVAAYNAGPQAVRKHNGVPPYQETRRYVKTVLGRYQTSPLREER
jgi:hypothetical protein